jgi:(p)ppGpp synthase/HD superfamily hydrolase
MLTERFDQALVYASAVHRGHKRKGTEIPYLSHLMSVSALVLEAGGDEDMAIAALLHDAAEDCGGQARLDDIRVQFGGRVAQIVEACSDSLTADPEAKAHWVKRKTAYLKKLKTCEDDGVLLVGCADKLHNARAILTDYRTVGERVWERFGSKEGGKTPGMIVGYYSALSEVFLKLLGPLHPLARELELAVALLVGESGVEPDLAWRS